MKKITHIDNQIKKELQKKGLKPDDSIDYVCFLELYEPYKKQISEKDFATILGISNATLLKIPKNGRAVIWKTRNIPISEEIRERIKNELRQRGLKQNQLIDYPYFLELYEPYKNQASERQFAEILGINSGRFTYLKKQGNRTTVWGKKYERISEEEKKTIAAEQRKKGFYPGRFINYTIFLQLYENYKDRMSEPEFANVLGIAYNSYEIMKNRNAMVKIWNEKGSEITTKQRQEIEKELEDKGVTSGSRINYSQFLELYEPYKKRLSEKEFASILDISYSNYACIKTKKQNAVVWKKRHKVSNEEQIRTIEGELRERGLKIGSRINYKDFIELHEPYKNKISEENFATLLGIGQGVLKSMKTKNKSAIIWKNQQRKITEDDKERIRQELKERGIKNGKKLNYPDFLELYEAYRELFSEADFALAMGISYSSYTTMKGKKANITVNYNKEEIERIKHLLAENRFYSEDELEKISRTYDISMEQIVWGNKKSNPYGKNLLRVLQEQHKLYIGKRHLSKKCMLDNQEQLKAIIKKWTLGICRKYNCQYCAGDIAASCLEYVITNCGDVEANFEEEFIKYIPYKITTYIKNACFNELHRTKKLTSSERRYTSSKGTNEKMQIEFRDETIDVQATVLENLGGTNITQAELTEEHYISTLMKYIKKGLNNDEAIRRTALELNVDQAEMIKRMQDYLISSKRVVKTKDGILYERDD